MTNRDKIVDLLQDIRKLEVLVENGKEVEIHQVSFFSQTFDLSHRILTKLHTLETDQIDVLRKQMEEHQALLQSIPVSKPQEQPPLPEKPINKIQENKQDTPEPEPLHETVNKPETEVGENVNFPEEKAETTFSDISHKEIEEIVIHPQKETSVSADRKEPQPIEKNQETCTDHIISSQEIKPSISDKPRMSLNEVLAKKGLADFKKAFSLNDRFYFRKELFKGDEETMNQTIIILNEIHSYEESVAYVKNQLQWGMENPCVKDFMQLLEKRFL